MDYRINKIIRDNDVKSLKQLRKTCKLVLNNNIMYETINYSLNSYIINELRTNYDYSKALNVNNINFLENIMFLILNKKYTFTEQLFKFLFNIKKNDELLLKLIMLRSPKVNSKPLQLTNNFFIKLVEYKELNFIKEFRNKRGSSIAINANIMNNQALFIAVNNKDHNMIKELITPRSNSLHCDINFNNGEILDYVLKKGYKDIEYILRTYSKENKYIDKDTDIYETFGSTFYDWR